MRTEECDALLEVLSHVFEADEDIEGLVYLDIQKLLFHLRERLDDENSIAELLPYYWYIDGTVSDTVQEAVNHGVETGALITEPTARTGTGQWYELSEGFRPSTSDVDRDDVEAAKRAIETVLEEDYDVFGDHDEKIADIYADAPYDFQRYFKFDVLFELKRFADGYPMFVGPEGLQANVTTAEAYLPLEPDFEEFNRLFSRYVNTARRYFDAVGADDRTLADRFLQLSESIWRLYCQQLRLLEHDPYYESSIDEWREEYDRTKALVANDLVEFRRLLGVEFEDVGEASRVPEDSTWGRIAAAYLGTADRED